MIRKLKASPSYWLTLRVCEIIFEKFKDRIQFDEPIPPFDTRFIGRLEGILESVQQTFDGKHLNPTVLDAAASYFNLLTRSQAFRNGNKRLAIVFTHMFLFIHDIDFTVSEKGLYNMAILVARASEQNVSMDRTKEFCKSVIEHFTKDIGSKH